jgi:hypothetical protein
MGIPATEAKLGEIRGIAAEADGSFLVSSNIDKSSDRKFFETARILRISKEGKISTVAGTSTQQKFFRAYKPSGDGKAATKTDLHSIGAVTAFPDGSFAFVDGPGFWIRVVSKDGIIRTIPPTQVNPKTNELIGALSALPDGDLLAIRGTLSIGYSFAPRTIIGAIINRINLTSGKSTLVAGIQPDKHGNAGDGGPATKAAISAISVSALPKNGFVFLQRQGFNPSTVKDTQTSIRHVDSAGKISTMFTLTRNGNKLPLPASSLVAEADRISVTEQSGVIQRPPLTKGQSLATFPSRQSPIFIAALPNGDLLVTAYRATVNKKGDLIPGRRRDLVFRVFKKG